MIEVAGLTKAFGAAVAVDDLAFTVPDGAVTGFLGPNGAGKSTTMRCLLGLDLPDAGRVLVDGHRLRDHHRPARVVGAVLDTAWYHPGRTGRGHLRVVAASAGLPSTRVDEVLAAVGLTTAADRRVRGYSLGMRQRLGLAAALLGDPRNLVLDEPVNGLDPEGVHWMRSVLRQAADAGRAVLVSSHLLAEMQVIADRLVVLGRGRLLGEGTLAAFLDRRGHVLVRTDGDELLAARLRELGVVAERTAAGLRVELDHRIPDAPAVSRLCRDLGLLVTALGEAAPTLEDVFLDLTDRTTEFRGER